jgi:hypothetical protein
MNRYLFEMMLRLINEQLDAQEGLLTEVVSDLPSRVSLTFGPNDDVRASVTADGNFKESTIDAQPRLAQIGQVVRQTASYSPPQRGQYEQRREAAFNAFMDYLKKVPDPPNLDIGAGRENAVFVGRVVQSGSQQVPFTRDNIKKLPTWHRIIFPIKYIKPKGYANHIGNLIKIGNMGSRPKRNAIINNLMKNGGVTYEGWTFKIDPNHGLLDIKTDEGDFNVGGVLTVSSDTEDINERFNITFSGGSSDSNVSELFEGNLLIALNGHTSSFPPQAENLGIYQVENKRGQLIDIFIGDPGWQNIANDVIANITGSGLGTELANHELYDKPGTADKLTDIYKFYKGITKGEGAPATRTPKTDIASDDNDKTLRISVKKKGASLLSPEFSETKAFMAIALGFTRNNQLLNDPLFNNVKNALESPPRRFARRRSVSLRSAPSRSASLGRWAAAGSQPQRIPPPRSESVAKGKNALNEIYDYINIHTLKIDFKKAFLLEAMTGNHKFPSGSVAIANRLLSWDENGAGSYYDINDWVNKNYNNVTFRARSRGQGRSVGLGIEQGTASLQEYAEISNEEINDRSFEIANDLIDFLNILSESEQSDVNTVKSFFSKFIDSINSKETGESKEDLARETAQKTKDMLGRETRGKKAIIAGLLALVLSVGTNVFNNIENIVDNPENAIEMVEDNLQSPAPSEESIKIPYEKINEFILTAIGYSLKEVDPGSNTVTIGYPDEEQERILQAMVQEMLGSPGKPEAPVQQDTETEISDNVVALDPKDVKSTKDDEEIEVDVKDDEQEEQEEQEQNNTEET